MQELRLARRFAAYFPQSVKDASVSAIRRLSGTSQELPTEVHGTSPNNHAMGRDSSDLPEPLWVHRNGGFWNSEVVGSGIGATNQTSTLHQENSDGDFSFLDFFSGLEGPDGVLR